MKSFRSKEDAGDEGSSGDGPGGRNAEVDFRGTKRGNDMHALLGQKSDALRWAQTGPYDIRDFVSDLRDRCVTPHVAQNTGGRRSTIDGRTTRHAGYAASHRIRKRIEEVFGWAKSAAGQDKTRFSGLARVRFAFTLTVAAYNVIRLRQLLETG